MNASSQSFPNGAADAEITAELPVLDVAAYEARHANDPLASTDTWSTPTLNTAQLAQAGLSAADAAPEPAQAAPLPANMAAKLEAELRSLGSNLKELETRLAAKGERLVVIEKELAESRVAGQAAAERAQALSDELTGSRAAVAAASTQIKGLQATIRERDDWLRSAGERAGELEQRLHRREADLLDSAAAGSARVAELTARHEATLKASGQQVAQLQVQSAAQLEILHSLEGRRGIFDSMLRGLDLQLAGRDQDQAKLSDDLARNATQGQVLNRQLETRSRQVQQLEAEVAALKSSLGVRTDEAAALGRTNAELNQSLQTLRAESGGRTARIAELEAQVQAGIQSHALALQAAAKAHGDVQATSAALLAQKTALEADLTALREQSAEHAAAVQKVTAEHAGKVAQIQTQETQLAALAAQVATQGQALVAEGERNRVNQERIAGAENDLRVSEEAINRLESELRARNMRVEELMRINSQMQSDIADARRWLGERDSLMQRLESETAHSAALVDNIQRSIRSIAPGNTGPHEVIREQGARLLVRSQDGHEVVHVLGRKTTIGRTPDNDLQIDASFISRHHAVLLANGNQTIIEDLNSTNGIYVNGHRSTRETLNDGDLVMVGKARFRFVIRPAINRNPEHSA
ncbi:MAG TPA: FHA domain-containing protein [Steroidobacteraceae bacterium]|nr:FHA domain-containing protein [Steroidobacteraceae bacterium]